jgi:hypothetical protein
MPCNWLVKGTKEYCTRPTKNEYCAIHAFAIRKGTTPPKSCVKCGNGTNSSMQLCIPCGQNKVASKLWRERKATLVK